MKLKAKVLRVLDGDTVDVTISFPFGISVKKRVRLFGINTPETRTKDPIEKAKGYAAKDRLDELLREGGYNVTLVYHGDGKFGRPLGELYIEDKNLNDILISEYDDMTECILRMIRGKYCFNISKSTLDTYSNLV